MNLNMDLHVEEAMREKLVQTTGRQRRRCCASTVSGCLCRSLCHCVSFAEGPCAAREEPGDEELRQLLESTEGEESLQRFLRLEQLTAEVREDNENYKKQIEYLEANYRNQYNYLDLLNKDRQLQIDDLQNQLRAAQQQAELKAAEASETAASLRRKREEADQLADRARDAALEAERLKGQLAAGEDAKAALLRLLEERDRRLERLEEEAAAKADSFKKTLDDYAAFIGQLQAANREAAALLLDGNNKYDNLRKENLDLQKELNRLADLLRQTNSSWPVEKAALEKTVELKDDNIGRLERELADANRRANGLADQLASADEKGRQADSLGREAKQGQADLSRRVADLERELEAAKQREANALEKALDKDHDAALVRQDLDAAKFELAKAQQQAQKHKDAAEEQEELKRRAKEVADDLEAKLAAADSRERELAGSLQRANGELDAASRRARELADESEKASGQTQHVQETLDAANKQNADLEVRVKGLEDEVSELADKLKNASGKGSAEVLAMENDLRAKARKLKELQEENDELRRDGDAKGQELDTLRPAMAAKDREIGDLLQRIKDLKEELSRAEKNIEHLTGNGKRLQRDLEASRAENAKVKGELSDKAKELDKASKELEGTKSALARANDEAKKYQQIASAQEDEIAKLRRDLAKLELDLAAKTKENDETLARYQALLAEFNKLKVESLSRDEFSKLKGLYDKLMVESQSKGKDLNNKQEELDRLKQQMMTLEGESNEWQLKYKALMEELKSLKLVNSRLIKRIEEIMRTAYSCKVMIREISDLLLTIPYDNAKDEERIKTTDDEKQISVTLELLNEVLSTKNLLHDKIENLKDTEKRLVNETGDLKNERNQIKDKLEDLTKRYELKTDMVGKLTIKNFLIMSELDRMIKKPADA